MMPMELLLDAISLYRKGRTQAAVALWSQLPQPLQIACIEASLLSMREEMTSEWANISSPWGNFTLSKERRNDTTLLVDDLKTIVPRLASG